MTTLTGDEVLLVVGQISTGNPAAIAFQTTTQDIANLGGGGSSTTENVFTPEQFGAKGNAYGDFNGVISGSGFDQFSSTTFTFTPDRVGNSLWFDTTLRTITAVNAGVATFTPANGSGGTNINWFCGTDDTVAIQAALDAARAVQGQNVAEISGDIDGIIPSGGICQLASGKCYVISNSEASYNAGKLSALQVARRTNFSGSGQGLFRSGLALAPNSYGHMVANIDISGGPNSFSDFITISNMALYGYKQWNANALNNLHLEVAGAGFDVVDPVNRIYNVSSFNAAQSGFYFHGRGELVVQSCFSCLNGTHGYWFQNQEDYHVIECNSAGSQLSGFRVDISPNGHYTNCKSYFSGGSGGTSDGDCANWHLTADQMRSGLCYYTNCEGQESRGSSWVIENSGLNILVNCIGNDPGRESLSGGTLPAVRSSFYLKGGGACQNTFKGCYGGPAVILFNEPDNWGNGTDAFYIDGVDSNGFGPQFNRGDFYTFVPTIKVDGTLDPGTNYPSGDGPVGGGGSTNGRNYLLYVNGVALPTTVAAAPVNLTAMPGSASATLNWSLYFNGGSPITDYVVQYKLHSSPTWLTFSHSPITAGPITVTGLTNNSTYDFQIAATNVNGTGPFTEIMNITITVSVPSQVTGLVATGGTGFVGLNWPAPFDGNSPITDYFVEYKLTSSGTWLTLAHTASTTPSQYLIDTTTNSYDFRVSAINAIGTGAVSAVSSATPTAVLMNFDASITANITSSGGAVSSFVDASGNGYTAVQATGGDQPITGTSTINGLNVITYDGVNDYLKAELPVTGFLAGQNYATIFSVISFPSGASSSGTGFAYQTNNVNTRLIENGASGGSVSAIGKMADADIQWFMTASNKLTTNQQVLMCVRVRSGATSQLISSAATGSPLGSSTTNDSFTTVTDQSILLGTFNTGFGWLNCSRGQDVVYGNNLSDTDINGLGNALAFKWGQTWTNI